MINGNASVEDTIADRKSSILKIEDTRPLRGKNVYKILD